MKNKNKKAPIRTFIGLDHDRPTPVDMSQYKPMWASWLGGREVYYWDRFNIRQVRYELWDDSDDSYFLLKAVIGIKDDLNDGECINLKW